MCLRSSVFVLELALGWSELCSKLCSSGFRSRSWFSEFAVGSSCSDISVWLLCGGEWSGSGCRKQNTNASHMSLMCSFSPPLEGFEFFDYLHLKLQIVCFFKAIRLKWRWRATSIKGRLQSCGKEFSSTWRQQTAPDVGLIWCTVLMSFFLAELWTSYFIRTVDSVLRGVWFALQWTREKTMCSIY